jgi:hypothetical protein
MLLLQLFPQPLNCPGINQAMTAQPVVFGDTLSAKPTAGSRISLNFAAPLIETPARNGIGCALIRSGLQVPELCLVQNPVIVHAPQLPGWCRRSVAVRATISKVPPPMHSSIISTQQHRPHARVSTGGLLPQRSPPSNTSVHRLFRNCISLQRLFSVSARSKRRSRHKYPNTSCCRSAVTRLARHSINHLLSRTPAYRHRQRIQHHPAEFPLPNPAIIVLTQLPKP